MAEENRKYFITVILPLKLSWDAWYYSEIIIATGTRVIVRFAGRQYTGVVSGCSDTPGFEEDKILPIEKIDERLEPISEEEIRLWKFISEYYLCSIGEVYKAAHPQQKTAYERKKNKKELAAEKPNNLTEQSKHVNISFEKGKPVLFISPDREPSYQVLIQKTLAQGKDVLYLSPACDTLSYVEIRELSKCVRSKEAEPRLIRGRRTQLFLPFSKLGLIIVDEEQDSSYKQESPAPRYNGRDVAIMLAGIHGAKIVLGSSSPSLESIQNAHCGKYTLIRQDGQKGELEVIDSCKEARKNGMEGDYSKKLLAIKENIEAAKQKILISESWETAKLKKLKPGKYSAVALLHFEFLLSRQDFRADEKALQLIESLRSKVPQLIIQTKDDSHPVFKGSADLLAERRNFQLPPFTRQVRITVKDNNKERKAKMSSKLASALAEFRPMPAAGKDNESVIDIYISKDKSLSAKKNEIRQRIHDFEQSANYAAHITIDIDPI